MIYQCDTCSRTTFEVNCPWCSGVSPVKTSAWGSASSTAQAIDIQRMRGRLRERAKSYAKALANDILR